MIGGAVCAELCISMSMCLYVCVWERGGDRESERGDLRWTLMPIYLFSCLLAGSSVCAYFPWLLHLSSCSSLCVGLFSSVSCTFTLILLSLIFRISKRVIVFLFTSMQLSLSLALSDMHLQTLATRLRCLRWQVYTLPQFLLDNHCMLEGPHRLVTFCSAGH